MAKKQAEKKTTTLYIRRLASNEYVQGQLRNAASALGKAYRRAATGRGQAIEDKKLYDHVREAMTSIRNATRALQRRRPEPEPEPEPEPKHRGRKLVTIAVAGGGVAMLAKRLGRQKASPEASADSAATT